MMTGNSQEHSILDSEHSPLPTLDSPNSENFSENREESQDAPKAAPDAPNTPVYQLKSTRTNFGKPANKYSDFYL